MLPMRLIALAGLLAAAGAATAEPTESELRALAENPALRAIDLPFLAAPAASRRVHVEMADGIRLAVSLWFPAGMPDGPTRAPSVFIDSIYGTAEDASTTAIDLYRAAGFVVAIGDARGYGASFGSQAGFNTSQQTADEAAIVAWIAAQAWSDGTVAAVGHSVSAVFADSLSSSGAPALKAAIIRASDFDEYDHNMFPGGAPNLGILGLAAMLMEWHRGAPCIEAIAACPDVGFIPVDGDDDLALLRAALAEHDANPLPGAFAAVVYRDDPLGETTVGGAGGIDRIDGIRAAAVPARVSASWLDGITAAGALARYTMASEVPMEVVIGATTHAGGLDADPFATEPFAPADPRVEVEIGEDIAFLQRVLRGEKVTRSLRYTVLGTDVWKTTAAWPPEGVTRQTLWLSPDALTDAGPAPGEVAYTVDPTSTSGQFNRWGAQRGRAIFFGDRRDLPGQRLEFTGAAFADDAELVGAPSVCLKLASDQPDGLVIATLEDVAPDGRVTYLTEGLLRLLHRGDGGCEGAQSRSFNRADGAPVVPGEAMEVGLALYPVAAKISRGHALRLTLAGADAGWFEPLTDSPATWTVAVGTDGSTLSVPLRAWSE